MKETKFTKGEWKIVTSKAFDELNGVVTHCSITSYIPPKYCPKWDEVDMSILTKDYSGMLRIDSEQYKDNIIKIARGKEALPYVFINTTNPRAIISPICNVKYTTNRNYGLFGWCIFGVYTLVRLINKGNRKNI